ncbi:MAG: hypothetical protein Tsb002_37710 [Wenzhouxiangellaceae bacterium]
MSAAEKALAALHNLGPQSARMLCASGITNIDQLRSLGAVECFLRVQTSQQRPSLNLLWAIAGALHGCHWNRLPAELRSSLLLELDARRHPF